MIGHELLYRSDEETSHVIDRPTATDDASWFGDTSHEAVAGARDVGTSVAGGVGEPAV